MAENRPTPQAAPAPAARREPELNAFDPAEGSGQKLSAGAKSAAEAQAELEEARRKADEQHQKAQMEIRAKQRALAEAELEKSRAEAMKAVEEQDAANQEMFKKFPGTAQVVHPAYLELEAARVRAEADARQIDETVPGGCYIVDGRKVDADGRPLE